MWSILAILLRLVGKCCRLFVNEVEGEVKAVADTIIPTETKILPQTFWSPKLLFFLPGNHAFLLK